MCATTVGYMLSKCGYLDSYVTAFQQQIGVGWIFTGPPPCREFFGNGRNSKFFVLSQLFNNQLMSLI